MTRALVLLADGFEEIEAVTPIDVLRRAGVEVTSLGAPARRVRGARGVVLEADQALSDFSLDQAAEVDVVVLPGGMPGAENLARTPQVAALVRAVRAAGKRVAAICAAPAVTLAPTGLLSGRRATCYPGFEQRFASDVRACQERVVVDDWLVTSRGPGTALEFALTLVEQLQGAQVADELRSKMLVPS